MAVGFLSIPHTSWECERAFSGGERTATTDRNELVGVTIEPLQLQKNWLRNAVEDSELDKLVARLNRLPKSAMESSEDVGLNQGSLTCLFSE